MRDARHRVVVEVPVRDSEAGAPGTSSPSPPLTAKPWFCDVISTVPRARFMTGWFAPWCPKGSLNVPPPKARAMSWCRDRSRRRVCPAGDFEDGVGRALHRGRVSRPVGDEEAVRFECKNLAGPRLGGEHGDPHPDRRAGAGSLPLLRSRMRPRGRFHALPPAPRTPVPSKRRTPGRVPPFWGGQGSVPGALRQGPRLRQSPHAWLPRCGYGVSAPACRCHGCPRCRGCAGSPRGCRGCAGTGRPCRFPDDEAGNLGTGRLHVLVVGPVVADQRVGHGDELTRVGGVRQHLLIAGHRGVEDDLAIALPRAPSEMPLNRRPSSSRRQAGRTGPWSREDMVGADIA